MRGWLCPLIVLALPFAAAAQTSTAPPLANLRADRWGPTWVTLAWESNLPQFEVSYRTLVPKGHWRVSRCSAPHFTVLGLPPDTPCEFTVHGVGSLPTLTLNWRTTPLQPRQWGTLRLWPSRLLTPGAVHPCLDAYKDALYVTESRAAGLFVMKVRPDTGAIEKTWPLPADGKQATVLCDTCVYHDRLYVLSSTPDTGPPGLSQQCTRLALQVFDLTQEKVIDPPAVLLGSQPGAGCREGALGVFRDRLWVARTESWREGERTLSRAILTPWDDAGPGEAVIWQDKPEMALIHPTLAVFEEEMLMLFIDHPVGNTGVEPLWALRYDGVEFHGLQKLAELGSNRDPRALQIGANLYIMHASNVAYATADPSVADLVLTAVGPGGFRREATAYVDDRTANASPELASLGSVLYVVYDKRPDGSVLPETTPAEWWGTYLGRIETSAWTPATPAKPGR
jgi:hypothetical protein